MREERKSMLIVISGPSGVGKGTLVKELLKRFPEKYVLSISATTRKPRTGEQDGREYFFKTKDEFREMLDRGDLLEHAVYNNNYYGTPKEYVLKELSEGKNVILEIEVQGGLQVKAIYPEAQLLYIVPPDATELFNRLKNRGTETEDEIRRRLLRAIEETEYMRSYDFIATNDDLDRCTMEIHSIIEEERLEFDERQKLAARLREELKNITREV